MADYRRQWNEYRHYRELTLIALVGLLPFGALVRFVAVRSGVPWIFMLLMFGWLVFLSYGASGMGSFRCPRCEKRFFQTWWYRTFPFGRKCVHCGLQKFSNG